MFKLVRNLTFWWPVKIIEPDPDQPGKFMTHQFEAEFLISDREEDKKIKAQREAILKRAGADQSEENLAKCEEELEALNDGTFRRAIQNWRQITDENGDPLLFNDTTFAAAMKHERIRVGLTKAYQEAISDQGARLGN